MTEEERDRAVAAADEELERIGFCPWLEGKQQEIAQAERGSAARRQLDEAFLAHAAGCAQCTQRIAVMDRLFAELETPFQRAISKVIQWHARQPEWIRPALTGAGFFGAYSVFRIVASALFGQMALKIALEGLLLSTSIGGGVGLIGGNAYRFFKPRGERWGPLGPYLAGIGFAAALGLATALVLLAIPETSPTFRRPFGWLLTGAFVLVGGIGAGGAWFRKGTKFEVV